MTLTLDKTGERLDAALARLVPSLSRSQAQRLIEQGAVTHGGRPVKKNEKLSAGDTLELTLPEVREVPIEAQPIPLEVCYEDADVIVVAYGASSRVARSAVNKAREAGKKVGLIRPITLWPFPKDAIKRAADHAKELLVVEMSMGQMVDDVRLAAECRVPVHFYGRTGGVIPTPKEILGEIDKLLK